MISTMRGAQLVLLAVVASTVCSAVRVNDGTSPCSEEPRELTIAFALPVDGKVCSDFAQVYAKGVAGTRGLTCGVVETEADCQRAATLLQVTGSASNTFAQAPSQDFPGRCSVERLLSSPLRFVWNNSTREVPLIKSSRPPRVDLSRVPVCGCYTKSACQTSQVKVRREVRRKLGSGDFTYNGFDLHRVTISGVVTNEAILRACQGTGLRPVCDHSAYADGQCEMVGASGSAWHFSLPQHAGANGVPLDKVQGAYFYTGAGQKMPLQNVVSSHRWASQDVDKSGGATFCANPVEPRDFRYGIWTLVRTPVSGTMESANIDEACLAAGMRPVCGHAHQLDGRCAVVGGAWHLSYPEHDAANGVDLRWVQGAFFYAGKSARTRSFLNTGTSHRLSNSKDAQGDTFCVKPMLAEQSFEYRGYSLQRVAVRGEVTSSNLFQTCNKLGLRPVCDHAYYMDGRCLTVGGAWHFSFPAHDAENGVPLESVKGAYFYGGSASSGRSLANLANTHRWSADGEHDGDTFCAKPRRDPLSFTWKNYALKRVEVQGEMNSTNILAACQGVGLLPVCDHSYYLDGRCVVVGGAWHFSHPQHDAENEVEVKLVQGAYFYAGAANRGRSLVNMANTHRWSTRADQGGDTYCTKPRREEQSFDYNGYKLKRVPVEGEVNSDSIFQACAKVGLRPVCDHAYYLDGRCLVVGGAWHFSHPGHNAENKVPVENVKGAYFYAGFANNGRALSNNANTHRWTSTNDRDGDTFCSAPRREALSFTWNRHEFRRTQVNGTMNSDNIRAACQGLGGGFQPVCDHAAYKDSSCIAFGNWHFSFSGDTHACGNVPDCRVLTGAYFYAGASNSGWSLKNVANSHRWSVPADEDGDTYCARLA